METAARKLVRPMVSRDPEEVHRAATPLELLFDLCFVVAVAQASAHMHHALAEGQFAHALLAYIMVFFAVWWAWMNFTWFASAYDTDDVPFRLNVLLQISGVLVLAAGVPQAFDSGQLGIVTLGYAIMRVGLVSAWLRAARADTPRRSTAYRYAIGVSALEVGWIALLVLPQRMTPVGFCVLALLEMIVPTWAERHVVTRWHAHHVAERYGCMTLIVLGESVSSALLAIQSVLDAGHLSLPFSGLIVGSLVLLFAMWWLYFDQPIHGLLASNRQAFVWGYGHFVVFGSTAAVGAGLAVFVDFLTGHTEIACWQAGASVAVPSALYLLSVWALQLRPLHPRRVSSAVFLGVCALMLAASASQWAVPIIGVLFAGLVALWVGRGARERHHPH